MLWFKKFMFRLTIKMLRRYVLTYYRGDSKFWETIDYSWMHLIKK